MKVDSEINVPIVSDIFNLNFKANEHFNKRNGFTDGAFSIKRKANKKYFTTDLMNLDSLSAFLDIGMDSIEKLVAAELGYGDLASLTESDLELIGFKYSSERETLLQYFAELPNQDPSFEQICANPEAQKYNAIMMRKPTEYLESMKHALNGVNYKLQIALHNDTLVGDRYFASHFVNEALDELNGATREVEDELEELLKTVGSSNGNHKEKPKALLRMKLIFLAAAGGLTAMAAYWYIKNHNQ